MNDHHDYFQVTFENNCLQIHAVATSVESAHRLLELLEVCMKYMAQDKQGQPEGEP